MVVYIPPKFDELWPTNGWGLPHCQKQTFGNFAISHYTETEKIELRRIKSYELGKHARRDQLQSILKVSNSGIKVRCIGEAELSIISIKVMI